MRNIYFTITTLLFLLGDILSKIWIENSLSDKIEVIPSLVSIEKVYNTGIAFSVPIPLLLLKSITIVLIFGIIGYYFYDRKNSSYSLYDLGFSMIIGGALGNAVGRILDGQVLDFIAVSYFSVFNLADSFICVGAALLIYHYWKIQKSIS